MPDSAEPPAERQPLGSLQQQEARTFPSPAPKPAGAQRKRERSPQAPQPLPPAAPAGGRKGARQQAAGKMPAAVQPAASPSSKRSRPHVAFGTRCDAPRPAPRGSRPLKLQAAGAPTPPQLPPVLPEGPARPPAQGHVGAAAGGEAAAGGPGPSARSDLLRSLAATFAGGEGGDEAGPVGTTAPAQFAAAPEAPGSDSAGLQRLLSDLTAVLQGGAQPPAEVQPQAAAGLSGQGPLQAALLQHGMQASVLQDAGSLLQVRGICLEV